MPHMPPLIGLLLVTLLSTACQAQPSYDPSDRPASVGLPSPADGPIVEGLEQLHKNPEHENQSGFYLLHEGLSAFVARVALIEVAQSSLDLQYYIVSDDTSSRIIIAKLLEAADRGVRVRLLVDDLGTRVAEPLVATLEQHPNIHIRIFNPVAARSGISRAFQMATHFGRTNHRMHNKLMVADSSVLITGGRNLGDEYFSNSNVDFQDVDVMAVGKIVPDGAASFDLYWNTTAAVPINHVLDAVDADMDLATLRRTLNSFLDEQTNSEFANALSGSSLGRRLVEGKVSLDWGQATLYADPPEKATARDTVSRDDYLGASLKTILDSAEQRLQISSAYFVPGDAGVALFSALTDRGVKVDILTNSLSTTDVAIVHSGYVNYRKPLLENGIRLWELRAEAGQQERIHWFKGKSRASLHAKTFVIDDDRTFIGSVNLDGRSILQNTEIGLLIESESLNQQLSQLFSSWISDDSAWHVSLNDENELQWQASNADSDTPLTVDHDPETSRWQRIKVWVLSWLPIESQI
ncbi:phospholipase D family protein [Alcanivorax sp.]|uniref:phospholipase D family protein n=1 Tax=Alcanivorax sp. TaxID=1872427 RepID=UPI0025C4D898|nr:phospholipase D family protein [Alcanivorax sp.]